MTKGEKNMVRGLEEDLARTENALRKLLRFLREKHPRVLAEFETEILFNAITGKGDSK